MAPHPRILGFIGTGTITEAMVRGLKRSSLAASPVVLSPRNATVAQRLARGLPGVTIAPHNQAVVEAAGIIVLAVRPQVAEAVLADLRLPPDRLVISLIAGLDHDRIAALTGARRLCRAVPLPFIAQGRDATPVFPPDPEALALFQALGGAIAIQTRAEFDLLAALSALMGSYFGLVGTAATWAEAQGLPESSARLYLSRLFANLGQVLQDSAESLPALREGHSTPGGLNEQVWRQFETAGGAAALSGALDSVLKRIRGGSPTPPPPP